MLFCYSCPTFSAIALPHSSPTLLHSHFPQCCPCAWVIHTCPLSSPFPCFPPLSPTLLPPGHLQSVWCFYASGTILFVSLFCSWDSSYRWDHMVFVFHELAYFTSCNILQFHPRCHEGQELLLSLCCVLFHCVNVPQFFDPLIHW